MRYSVYSCVLVVVSVGVLTACAGRSLGVDEGQGVTPGDGGPGQQADTGPIDGGPIADVHSIPVKPDALPPEDPNNPKGHVDGTITGDPSCPKTLSSFQENCSVPGAVCDVTLGAQCTGTKLRYMCVHYDSYSPFYWVEAHQPSLECSCPKQRPAEGSSCEISLPRECTYTNPICPSDNYARLTYSCQQGRGGGYWTNYGGWCSSGPWDGGWPDPDAGWDEPSHASDGGTPRQN